MKREDLFEAIGNIDEERLERSEKTLLKRKRSLLSPSHKEVEGTRAALSQIAV